MTDHLDVRIQGLPELMADLRRLPQVVKDRVLRGAMGTAAGLIKERAVMLAPQWTGPKGRGSPPPGTLKRAIYLARLSDKCTGNLEVWQVGVRSGKRFRHSGRTTSAAGPTQGTNLDAYYAVWVEYGHFSPTPHGPGTRAVRRVAARASGAAVWVQARPFMRPALEQTRGAAIRAFEDYVRRHLPDAQASVRAVRLLRAA